MACDCELVALPEARALKVVFEVHLAMVPIEPTSMDGQMLLGVATSELKFMCLF